LQTARYNTNELEPLIFMTLRRFSVIWSRAFVLQSVNSPVFNHSHLLDTD